MISGIRRNEMRQMHELINTEGCLSLFAVRCLDDHEATACGKCANCTGKDIYPNLSITDASRQAANEFMNSRQLEIAPRKRYPSGKMIPKGMQLQPGICLSRYGDPGYGEMVVRGKYPRPGEKKYFDDTLVEASARVLQKLIQDQSIEYITCVPSLRSDLVKDFTIRLASALQIRFMDMIRKEDAPQQKDMENSAYQFENADNSFQIIVDDPPKKVLLVDDVIDSRWTMTVCGIKLAERGCEEIYPFALADSSYAED